MRQGRWVELVKDYDCDIHYHPGKANRVADALSRKSTGMLMSLQAIPTELAKEIKDMGLEIIVGSLSTLIVQPILYDQIKEEQRFDPYLEEIRHEIVKKRREDF